MPRQPTNSATYTSLTRTDHLLFRRHVGRTFGDTFSVIIQLNHENVMLVINSLINSHLMFQFIRGIVSAYTGKLQFPTTEIILPLSRICRLATARHPTTLFSSCIRYTRRTWACDLIRYNSRKRDITR